MSSFEISEVGLLNAELQSPYCTLEDYDVILGIQDAIFSVEQEKFSFKFFDLGLSELEVCVLDELDIEYFNILFVPSNLSDLPNNISDFIKSLSLSNKNDDVANQVAAIISRLIFNVIDASAYEEASIYICSDLPFDLKYHDDSMPSFIDWHIDKTLLEVINPDYVSESAQLTYIFTLNGDSTLYHLSDCEFHKEFLSKANSNYLNLGCGLEFQCDLEDIFDLSLGNIFSAKFGQGSVHIAGRQFGTIHAAPHSHKRVVVIIIPESQPLIDEYYKAIRVMTLSHLN